MIGQIADDDVEVVPIYRSKHMVEKPVNIQENHNLHMKWEATRSKSHCKQPALSEAVPSARSLTNKIKIPGNTIRMNDWL